MQQNQSFYMQKFIFVYFLG